MKLLVTALLFACGALGQDSAERTFRLTVNNSPAGLQEIVTTLRTVGNIQQLSADMQFQTVTVKGTPDQLAFAAWLLPKLDTTAHVAPPQEFAWAGNPDDLVIVFFRHALGFRRQPAGDHHHSAGDQ